MNFDWIEFLNSRGVDYHHAGPGEVLIVCPWCGSDRLSINVNGRGWKCWRRPLEHKGQSPIKLILALTGCTIEQAMRIAGVNGHALPNDFASVLRRKLEPQPEPEPIVSRALPEEFKAFRGQVSSKPFTDYLLRRGFYGEIGTFTERYGLRYCVRGQWRYRIIFPIEDRGRLATWTGRTIDNRESEYGLRYHTPGRADGFPPITDYLLWQDIILQGGATLWLSEGPMDALKLMELAPIGHRATCFFTITPSPAQIALLYKLSTRYQRKYLLLDNNTLSTALRVSSLLTGLGIEIKTLPDAIKDPGELTSTEQLMELVR